MTELLIARRLLFEANARIFDLDCRVARQDNTIDSPSDELRILGSELSQPAPQQKREHSASSVDYQRTVLPLEDDASDLDELSLDSPSPRASVNHAHRPIKKARDSHDNNTTLRSQSAEMQNTLEYYRIARMHAARKMLLQRADAQRQHEQRIGYMNAAEGQVPLLRTWSPGASFGAGYARVPASSIHPSSATLSPERYAPDSPTNHDSRSSTLEQVSLTSPAYAPHSPAYRVEGNMMSPQQFSPTLPDAHEQEHYMPNSSSRYNSPSSAPEQHSPTYAAQSPSYYAEDNMLSPQQRSPIPPPSSPDYSLQDDALSPTYVPTSRLYGSYSPQYQPASPAYAVIPTSPPYWSGLSGGGIRGTWYQSCEAVRF